MSESINDRKIKSVVNLIHKIEGEQEILLVLEQGLNVLRKSNYTNKGVKSFTLKDGIQVEYLRCHEFLKNELALLKVQLDMYRQIHTKLTST